VTSLDDQIKVDYEIDIARQQLGMPETTLAGRLPTSEVSPPVDCPFQPHFIFYFAHAFLISIKLHFHEPLYGWFFDKIPR
jgi:hypothetical protein